MWVRQAATASLLVLALAGCGSMDSEGPAGSAANTAPPPETGATANAPPAPQASGRDAGGPSTGIDTASGAPGRSHGATSTGTGTEPGREETP